MKFNNLSVETLILHESVNISFIILLYKSCERYYADSRNLYFENINFLLFISQKLLKW